VEKICGEKNSSAEIYLIITAIVTKLAILVNLNKRIFEISIISYWKKLLENKIF